MHDRDALVTACGRICMHRKRVNISTVLAGQRLGIKEVDDGIWIVSFIHYDLGFIDLEQKTLQPLDNPFGTGLSPCLRYVPLPTSPVRTTDSPLEEEGFEPSRSPVRDYAFRDAPLIIPAIRSGGKNRFLCDRDRRLKIPPRGRVGP